LLQGGRYRGAKLSLPPVRKPPRIRSGDLVGVIAPAGPLETGRLEAGVQVLEGWGLRVTMGDAVRRRRAYLAGDDEERRADLQRMIDDPDVRAIFCARGGYGSQRLLPGLDLRGLAERPKPIVGYSDVTALLNAVVDAGAVAVHGPMVASDIARGLSRRSEAQLWSVLSDASYVWQAEVPLVIRPGTASGRLMGGNLTVLAATLGTPWAPDTDGAVLFLEDVREPPYRIDRLLTQMAQAGKLAHLAGMVFGTFAGCEPAGGADVLDVVRACCGDLPCPVGVGLPAGHDTGGIGCENLALPLGVSVVLDTERACLAALEPAVC
jgi:muramoyltetrapeptide carboxypeptidase